jgi:hypothetical protein
MAAADSRAAGPAAGPAYAGADPGVPCGYDPPRRLPGPAPIKPIALNRAASDQADDGSHQTDERLPEGSPDDKQNQAEARRVYEPDLPVGVGLAQEPPQGSPRPSHDGTVPGGVADGTEADIDLATWHTGTISLGIRPIGVSDRLDLGIRCTASARHRPCDTGANGPSMAHSPAVSRDVCWPKRMRADKASVPRETTHSVITEVMAKVILHAGHMA